MNPPPKPLSMKPDAIRHRRMRSKRQLEKDAAALAAGKPLHPKRDPKFLARTAKSSGGATVAEAGPVVPDQSAAVPTAGAAPGSIPLHTTKTVNVGGADRFAAVPTLLSSEGSPLPIVPPSKPDESASATDPPPAQGAQPGATITPEEAKLFGAALRQYFEFGTSLLLAKHPEMAGGLVAISGKPEDFARNFAIAGALVAGAGERIAIKYNLRIPYMDEAIVIGAIGVATFGIAGKPSKAGEAHLRAMQEQARAGAARDANPQPGATQQAAPNPAPNGKSTTPQPPPEPDGYASTPINPGAAGGVNLA